MGRLLTGGELVCLEGELGSGKTTFIQGIGWGLGCKGPITSPTFTLVNEYRQGHLTFYHVDLYRVESEGEIIATGLDDLFWGDGVCAVEWAEKARRVLPWERLWILFHHRGRGRRFISLEAAGLTYEGLLASWATFWEGR